MRSGLRAAACAVLVALGGSSHLASAQPRELPATIVTLGGHAEISRRAAPAWSPAALRGEVGAGDAVRVGGGRLTLRTSSGQSVRLAPSSQVLLLDGDAAASGPTRLRLDGGRIWVAVQPTAPAADQIEVVAGPVTALVRGGGAGIATNPDGSVTVAASHGSVTCSGPGWERALAEGQELLVPPTGAPKPAVKLKRDKRDLDWLKWNEDQDLAGGYGGRRPE
jgi:hypothetical protein